MELWDIYDENRIKTNKTHVRGKDLKTGDYHLVVHIWIQSSDGRFLIQKRAGTVAVCPGQWAVTGGSAITGETSWQACKREAEEELGIQIKPTKAEIVFTIMKKNNFCDIWLIRDDFALEDIKMQKEEVQAVAYVTEDEIRQLSHEKLFMMHNYIDRMFQAIHGPIRIRPTQPGDFATLYNILDNIVHLWDRQTGIFYEREKKKLSALVQQGHYYTLLDSGQIIGAAQIHPKNNPSVYIISSFYLEPEYTKNHACFRYILHLEGLYPQAKKFSAKIPEDNIMLLPLFGLAGYRKIFSASKMAYFEKINNL